MNRIKLWAALGLLLASAFTAQARSLDEVKKDGKINIATEGQFAPFNFFLGSKLSGFEVCRKIKDDPELRRVMVLMVTALNELGDIERAVEAGTDDYLSKPINKIALLKRVETMLKYKQTTDELERLRAYIREMEDDDKRAR